jgi:glucokinase
MTQPRKILVGDIGATKTALALFAKGGDPRTPDVQAIFPSRGYPSLQDIIAEFLGDKQVVVESACFDAAGPVIKQVANVTNLSWLIDARAVSAAIGGVPVRLLNDIEAISEAVPRLAPEDLEALNAGQAEEHGALAVVAPGGGLGEGFLVWNGQRYQACPSEGGHADFSPGTPLETELFLYLEPRFGHVSCERVCSGLGLPNVYAFLKDTGKYPEPDWLRQELAAATDKTPVISNTASQGSAEICVQTMQLFVSILAGEAGNLALKVLATGGVYLGGGIPPRILPWLKQPIFMARFASKGRLQDMLLHTPAYVIKQANAALFGAACCGLEM